MKACSVVHLFEKGKPMNALFLRKKMRYNFINLRALSVFPVPETCRSGSSVRQSCAHGRHACRQAPRPATDMAEASSVRGTDLRNTQATFPQLTDHTVNSEGEERTPECSHTEGASLLHFFLPVVRHRPRLSRNSPSPCGNLPFYSQKRKPRDSGTLGKVPGTPLAPHSQGQALTEGREFLDRHLPWGRVEGHGGHLQALAKLLHWLWLWQGLRLSLLLALCPGRHLGGLRLEGPFVTRVLRH